MANQSVTVTIHGRQYTINSFRDEEYTKNLARYCDFMMKKIDKGTSSRDYLQVAILSLLQMAHNYHEESERNKPAIKAQKEIERLIGLLEDTEKKIAEV